MTKRLALTVSEAPRFRLDRDKPTQLVADAAMFLGVGERTLRRALEPGGDLGHLAVRVGARRVLVKTAALLALVES